MSTFRKPAQKNQTLKHTYYISVTGEAPADRTEFIVKAESVREALREAQRRVDVAKP